MSARTAEVLDFHARRVQREATARTQDAEWIAQSDRDAGVPENAMVVTNFQRSVRAPEMAALRHHQYLRCAIKYGFNLATGRSPDGVL